MTTKMTPDEARAWMERWRVVEERQRDERRRESYEERFRALATLMASADLFDSRRLDEEDAVARARWARLQHLVGKR